MKLLTKSYLLRAFSYEIKELDINIKKLATANQYLNTNKSIDTDKHTLLETLGMCVGEIL